MSPTPPHTNISPLRPRDHEDAARVAISWLAERHRKGWRKAFEDLLDDWRPEGPEDGWQLDEDGMTMVSINAGEWLIARGQIHARGGLREINSYLLGHDGPYLTPGQKAWITQLRERPLCLYRVTDVRSGEGLTLVDELDAQAEPQAVRERSGSLSAKPGMLMGARIMQVGDAADGHQELSGAIYPFGKLRETQVLAQVRQALAGAAALKLHAENTRDLAEIEVARAWMAQWFEPAPLPQIRDAATGDAMLLVTDHYRVRDAVALAAALAAQPDVSGDAQQSWHRETRGGDGQLRSLAAINPGREADRIEVFYRTQRLADEGRTWFEALARSAVQHLTREITDPAGSLARASAASDVDAPTSAASPASGLPPEVLAQALEQFIHRHYAHWCDETIPALGGLTPRQAITTSTGLERVKGLLREYEDGERRQCAAQGRPAVSYQFLWDALGISR
ncbi:MAG: hypothetical protein Q8K96_14015 [Rubrivivax sp.]|nr:hypothetical protein [Rubrivivax sp.]